MKNGIVVIVKDYGRMCQKSFSKKEIFKNINLKKYRKSEFVVVNDNHEASIIEKSAKALKWDIKHLSLYP